MAAILNSAMLNSAILDSAILVFTLNLTHTLPTIIPPYAQKKLTHICLPTICTKKLHSFNSDSTWWWQPSWTCHVGFRHCHLGFRHLIIFSQIHSKTLSLHSDSESNYSIWLKLISFSPNLMMAAILNSAILDSAILHIKTSLIHSDSTWWWQPFWYSAMLDSDTAILDSGHLVIISQIHSKHSHSNLTLTQTNSIWLKLNHSHLTWWWQPSWILPCWILPSWIQLS